MKPRTCKARKHEATKKKSSFVVPDFTPEQWQAEWEEFLKARRLGLSFSLWAKQTKQWQAAWEESLKAEPPIAEQPKPKPEIRMSDHLANVRADDAKQPRTRSARPIGKLPLALERGGLDAVLWPWLKRWIENPQNKNAGEWRVIPDQGRYLCALVNCALVDLAMGPTSKEAKAQRVFTDSVAPSLTRRVLPMLRRRLKKLTLEDYKAVTRNPSPDGVKFSLRSHDKRAKLRAGLASLPKFQNKF